MQVLDSQIVPDTIELAERPKPCLTDAISHTTLIDYRSLFDYKMHSLNMNLGKVCLVS